MKEYGRQILKAEDIPVVYQERVQLGGKETSYVGIIEEDSKDTVGIGVHGYYQLVPNREVYDAVVKTGTLKIHRAEVYRNGRRMVMEVVPKNAIPVEILPKDEVIPMARIFNSYDGTRSIAIESFGIRKVCTNGMVAPTATKWSTSRIHIGNNIDFGYLTESIETAIKKWNDSENIIKKSNEIKVDSEVALFYTGLPNRYRMVALANLKPKDTVFNIWNEHTRITSHELDNKVQSIHRKQRQANNVFDFLSMTEGQIREISKALDEWNKKHNKR